MNEQQSDELRMRIACLRVVDAVKAEWPDSGKDLSEYIHFLADERMRLWEGLRQAEAKLALAEQDTRRLDWLEAHPNELRFEPFSRSGQAWACCPSTKIGNDGRPHS